MRFAPGKVSIEIHDPAFDRDREIVFTVEDLFLLETMWHHLKVERAKIQMERLRVE